MDRESARSEKFQINFFLDTNILCYLIDNTFPTLTAFIKALKEMPVVQLYSSEYVLAELFEVRKKEDYFHEVWERAKKDGKFINISSFIKYNKRYEIPDYEYKGDLAEAVKKKVNEDVEKITNEFKIDFLNSFNDKLLGPMKGICLSTKISREDSLVLVSSVYKNSTEEISERVILLTGDKDFYDWATSSKSEISTVFNPGKTPDIEHIGSLGNGVAGYTGGIQSLKTDIENVEDLAIQYVTSYLMDSYKDRLLGNVTIRECADAPKHLIAFKAETELKDNELYTFILTKDLSFLYSPKPISKLYHCGNQIEVPFSPEEGNNIVTFVCDENDEEVFNAVNVEGNLVFIHPDWEKAKVVEL